MPLPGSASGSIRASATVTGCRPGQYHGVVVTYAQVAAKPSLHRHLTADADTLVILDEVHHGGDALRAGATASATHMSRRSADSHSRAPRSAATPRRSRSSRTRPTNPARASRPPTMPTATGGPLPTGSCVRCCSTCIRARCGGAPAPVMSSRRTSGRTTPRTSHPRRGARRSTRRVSGFRRCCPPPTGGSPRSVRPTCRMPAAWCSRLIRPSPGPTPRSAQPHRAAADARALR